MANEKTELTDYLIYGVDLKGRRVYFGHPADGSEENHAAFTQASVEVAVRAIHKMIEDAPAKPIEIHMNSYGGDPYAMLRLYDEILASPCQIKFFGGGAIMSAATWIMAACDERYLYPNTTVMVHDGSEGYDGKHTDVQIDAAESKRLQNLLYDIYTNNSRMPKEFWEDVCQRDLYLTAEEAILLGLADKVIEYKKRGNLRRMRQALMGQKPDSITMKKLVNQLYGRINKVKVPKIELNEPKKEPADPKVIVDNSPQIETAPKPEVLEPLIKTEESKN